MSVKKSPSKKKPTAAAKKRNMLHDKHNFVRGRYFSNRPHFAVCVDSTEVTKKCHLHVAIDVASRMVIGHALTEGPPTMINSVDFAERFISGNKFMGPIKIVHTDSGSCYVNQVFTAVLSSLGVKHSVTKGAACQNQVVERLHSTLKRQVAKYVKSKEFHLREAGKTWTKLPLASQAAAFKVVVENYNNKPRAEDYKIPPIQIRNLLWAHGPEWEQEVPPLFSELNSTLGLVPAIEAEVNIVPPVNEKSLVPLLVANTPGPILDSFKEERLSLLGTASEVLGPEPPAWITELTERTKGIDHVTKRTLYEQRLALALAEQRAAEATQGREELKAQLDEVQQHLARERSEKLQKQLNRDLRKARKGTGIKRDPLTLLEFEGLLDLARGDSYVNHRVMATILLLYFTGLRVSNLLLMTVRDVKELLVEGTTVIPLIKDGAKKHQLMLSSEGRKTLNSNLVVFQSLIDGKLLCDPVFTAQATPKVPLSRCLFTRQLNQVLDKGGEEFSKTLKSHSFRITFATDGLKLNSIDDIRRLLGHRNPNTTIGYDARVMAEEDMWEVMVKLDEARLLSKVKASNAAGIPATMPSKKQLRKQLAGFLKLTD